MYRSGSSTPSWTSPRNATCVPWSDTPPVPEAQILASKDPLAIDAASFDLVNAQERQAASALRSQHGPEGGRKSPDRIRRGDRPCILPASAC
ncbi:MAG: DUF362 domain-containing protein [Methanothrix sp.]|nr:DUF362 domain-containing protein [Methanothrix sp.]